MGTDIHGYIEVKLNLDGVSEEHWQAAIDLFWLYDGQDTDAFGCFFGGRNYARFRPLAQGRGLPLDISPEIKRLTGNGNLEYPDHGGTWIGWSDIKQIDWEEKAEYVDSRIHRYRRNEQGELVYEGKSAGNREFAERVGYDQCLDDQEQVWDLGDVVYQSKREAER
jgi:hypothetical protein